MRPAPSANLSSPKYTAVVPSLVAYNYRPRVFKPRNPPITPSLPYESITFTERTGRALRVLPFSNTYRHEQRPNSNRAGDRADKDSV